MKERDSDRLVEDPVLGCRYLFDRRTDESGEELAEVEFWVDAGGGVTPHVHPVQEERFEILEGAPDFLGGRKWKRYGPGDTVVVPPGTRHAFRNRSGEVARIRCEARPPKRLQDFLTDVAALSRQGKLATRWGLPKGIEGILQAALLARDYRRSDDVVLLFPPLFLQRLIGDRLARIGERRGHRPGHYAEGAAP